MERDLEFSHFVIDKLGVIFASARDPQNKIHNFIVNGGTGGVLAQVNSHFEPISGERAELIRSRMEKYQSIVPTYRIAHFDFS